MGKILLSKLTVLLLIIALIVSSNLAAATLGGGGQGGPETNQPQPEFTNINHVGAINNQSDFNWNANAFTAYAEGESTVEIIVGIDNKPQGQSAITSFANQNGGHVTETLSMGNKSAVVVSIPTTYASTFVNNVHSSGVSRYVEFNGKYQATSVPNDINWTAQWGTQRVGADYAWNTTAGSSDIVVAVIDTGIDYTHPDLAACYIGGYDFVNNDADPLDDNGHGTHCSGIIAATINNSIGIAGVAQVKILAEKGLSASGSGAFTDLANCIINATNAGADILSNSWGGSADSNLISDAIDYATARGALVLVAAGNDNRNTDSYPAMYDNVVAVAASNVSDTKASFSDYGNWIDVAAPGVMIYSTFPTYHVYMNDMLSASGEHRFTLNYSYSNGTSMACPMAAGVAALIWSQFPNMDADAVRGQLESTCDDAGASGFDNIFGYGIVNASRGVTQTPVQHDLVARDWAIPSYLMLNEVTGFNLTTANRGAQSETNVQINLLVNGTVVNSTIIASLPSYSSNSMVLTWTPATTGTYNITYAIPAPPGETNLLNNILQTNYTVVAPPSNSNWTLLVSHPDSGVGYSPKTAYSQLQNGIVYFKMTFHRNWTVATNAIDMGISIDSDQNASTGAPLDYYYLQADYIGTDYLILVGVEGTVILRWNSTSRAWDSNTLPLLYLDAPNGSNTFVVGVSAGDIEVDEFFDCSFSEVTQITSNTYYWDWMPDTGYLPFKAQCVKNDLAVTLETERIYAPNTSYTITAKVFNYGQSNESNVNLKLSVNGQLTNSTTFDSIATNASAKVTYTWSPTKGYFNITAYATPLSSESIITNNLRTRFVAVSQKIAVISDNTELWQTLNILDNMNVNYAEYYNNYYYFDTANLAELNKYPVVIYYNYGRNISSAELSVLNQYLANGGKLLVTGYDSLIYTDAKLAQVVRAISSGDDNNQPDLYVTNSSHPIMNGPYGKFVTDYHVSGLSVDNDAIEANTTAHAITIAQLGDGKAKIIATENLPGTVVYWNGIGTSNWLNNVDCQAMFKNALVWLLNSSAPTTTTDYNGLWYNTAFTINLSAQSNLGVAQTYYRINGSAIKTVHMDGQPRITAEGNNNTLEYWSTDIYGSQETHRYIVNIKLDTTKPIPYAGNSQTITRGDTITFDGNSSTDNFGIVSYSWVFGDGAEGSGAQVSHTYGSIGIYTATLNVTDVAGNSAQASVTVYVNPKATSISSSSPTPRPTIVPTPTPTPVPTATPNTMPVASENGTTIQLSIGGNITSTQITDAEIHVNQTAATTTLSFNISGEAGSTGFGNITIPKSQVPVGTSPVIYIDGFCAEQQGYTEDENNYYVWYTTHFSTHELAIVFTGTSLTNAPVDYTLWIALAVVAVVVCAAVAVLVLRQRKPSV